MKNKKKSLFLIIDFDVDHKILEQRDKDFNLSVILS